jgi:histidinol phosphatase-like enzyme
MKIDMAGSFYCGDAAGRAKTATRPKDFTDTDIKFAHNAGL